jgi:glycerol-3-phosphate dehydrogenase
MEPQTKLETKVLIIGAGITGVGLARDLALRGVDCLVVDKQDVNSGASGGNHGLLHSGARYVGKDPASARQCQKENQLLKTLAPHCIEDTGGLFVAVAGDDEEYIAAFPEACRRCEIPVQEVAPDAAWAMEPVLSDQLIAVYAVNDAAIDPFRLSLSNMDDAQSRGARFFPYAKVVGFEKEGGHLRRALIEKGDTGGRMAIEVELVVNAAGAWAGIIAAMAGADVSLFYSKGSLLVTQQRLAARVLNRLRRASDGDILVPGGTVSILGTTSCRVGDPDRIYPEVEEVDAIIEEGAMMAPSLAHTRYIRAYSGVRPLVEEEEAAAGEEEREASRGYELIDHCTDSSCLDNFVTITGGKLTTYRLMAEKTADLVCNRLGIDATCRTGIEPLPDVSAARWTEPGLAPGMWLRRGSANDGLLCECEMVPQSVFHEIIEALEHHDLRPSLKAMGLRSRMGKGPCQGTFCSHQVTAWLYDQGLIEGSEGISQMRDFLQERWRGQHPLMWGQKLAQAELLEAMHCGFFGLEQSW